MTSEKHKDMALGFCVLLFALGGFLFVNPTDAPLTEGPGGLSWRTIPYIYSGLLLLLAVLFILITYFRGPIPVDDGGADAAIEEADNEARPEALGIRVSTVRRAGVVIALIAYSQALSAFGFAVSTPVFLFVVLWLFGRTRIRQNLLVSIIGGLALWLLFDHLLKMPLRGDLWDPVSPALTHLMRALGA